MENLKEHIAFKILAIALIITIAIPSVIKFSHVFTHHKHKHEICKGERTTHLHEIDLDCEFYKFKLNNNFTLPQYSTAIFIENNQSKEVSNQYLFLSNYQRLHFSLRGPPMSI
jgi:hypothetical protein